MDIDARAREVGEAIHDVLIHVWDPIGVGHVPQAQDEYDSYIGRIYRLLASGVKAEALSQYLYTIETEYMGLTPGSELAAARELAVTRLLALDIRLQPASP